MDTTGPQSGQEMSRDRDAAIAGCLTSLACDFFKLTATEGPGAGQCCVHFPIRACDQVLADRGYATARGSNTPDLGARQEFHGLLLAHYAVRKLMHEAALKADEDPEPLSFVQAVRVIRRKLPVFAATPSGNSTPA